MRSRRDSFGRQSFIPQRDKGGECSFCGQVDPCSRKASLPEFDGPVHRIYTVRVEPDSGPSYMVGHPVAEFCSWSCAEAYTGSEFPR